MQKRVRFALRFFSAMCLLVCGSRARAQTEGDLPVEMTATRRLFAGVGPGLRAIKRSADGRTYVLGSPSPGLAVYDTTGKQVLLLGAAATGKPGSPAIAFGEDCDVAADGTIYVADRGANFVQVFAADGTLVRSISVNAPVSVAAMPEEEVAVATLRQPHLVIVFDKNGRDVREFGDPEEIADRAELNRYLNIGQLATDGQGHLFYAFAYTPEPTVREYDRYGYARQEFQYKAIDALQTALAVRREIERQERRGDEPSFKRVLTAVGVDRATGEVWVALHSTLLRFDSEGTRRATYQLYTPEGARLEAVTILVTKDHLLIGSDPLGLYEFSRPDKSQDKK
jgi:hypothetical protein